MRKNVTISKGIGLRLRRDTRSVTAVEFALIGPVVFLFLFAVLLTGVVQFWQLTLDDSARNAARLIAIGAGNAASGIHNGSDLVNSICGEFGVGAPSCAGRLQYAVQGAPTFASGIVPATVSASGNLSPNGTYTGIAVGQPFLLQVVYPVPISIPLWPMNLITLNGTNAIISAAALVAEP